MKLRLSLLSALFTVSTLCVAPQAAAAYPDKPVKLLVGYGPGGATDIIARVLSKYLSDKWGQAVVVENKPGASGMIAANDVVRATPDGYTLLLGYTPEVSINQLVFTSMRYDPIKDLTPISLAAEAPLVLAVGAKLPVKSLKEILAQGKGATPLTYGSPGVGGQQHMAGEMLGGATKMPLTHIPYKGISPALTDMVGGRVEALIATPASVGGALRANQVRAIAVTTSTPSPFYPELPSMARAIPGYSVDVWWGVLGPADMPAGIVERLNKAISEVAQSPRMKEIFSKEAATPYTMSAKDFGVYMNQELDKWQKVAKERNIKLSD